MFDATRRSLFAGLRCPALVVVGDLGRWAVLLGLSEHFSGVVRALKAERAVGGYDLRNQKPPPLVCKVTKGGEFYL